jgi:hypothetical protein
MYYWALIWIDLVSHVEALDLAFNTLDYGVSISSFR